jgi:hypothetical protein
MTDNGQATTGREQDIQCLALRDSEAIGAYGPLERECLSAVGSESAVLVVVVPLGKLKRLALDHVSGFLLSLMDGATNVEAILDISTLPRPLALRHLRGLLERGVIVATYPLARQWGRQLTSRFHPDGQGERWRLARGPVRVAGPSPRQRRE